MATRTTENLAAVPPDGIAAAEEPARDVVEALQRVMRDLPGIGKGEKAAREQGGYAYRGIEQITRECQVLFARHGVTFVPEVTNYEIRDVTVGGKAWTDTVLTVSYTVYGPGGINRAGAGLASLPHDDAITVGPFVAIGRDGADKGANKAMTQAFKYALLQVLCISDKADEADEGSPEAEAAPRAAVRRDQGPLRSPAGEPTSAGNVRQGPRVMDGWADADEQRTAHDQLLEASKALSDEQKAVMTAYRAENGMDGWPLPKAQLEVLQARVEALAAQPF